MDKLITLQHAYIYIYISAPCDRCGAKMAILYYILQHKVAKMPSRKGSLPFSRSFIDMFDSPLNCCFLWVLFPRKIDIVVSFP